MHSELKDKNIFIWRGDRNNKKDIEILQKGRFYSLYNRDIFKARV